MNKIQLATKVAWSYHNMPYIWGGDDPLRGFDCSGLCISILKSAGQLSRGGDWRAYQLYEMFVNPDPEKFKTVEECLEYIHHLTFQNEKPKEGMLVFWHSRYNNSKIIHVEYCLDDVFAIGASGGGGENLTIQDAIDNNAYVKVRPFRSRKNIYGFVDPFEGDR